MALTIRIISRVILAVYGVKLKPYRGAVRKYSNHSRFFVCLVYHPN